MLFLLCHHHSTTLAEQQSTKQINLEDIERDNLESEKNSEILQTEQSQSAQQSTVGEKGESKESTQTDIRYAAAPSAYEGPAVDITYVTPASPPTSLDYFDGKSKFLFVFLCGFLIEKCGCQKGDKSK